MPAVNPQVTPIEIVRRFQQLRVLVIGDAMLDTYLEGTATRICAEGPVPVVRKTTTQRLPGGAANTAANLCALSASVLFLSVIGHDEEGSLLRTVLKENGISDRWCVEDEQASTLHKLRIIADGQYVVRFDEGGEQENGYTPATRQLLLDHLDILYPQCDLIVISDYVYGTIFDAFIERLHVLHQANPKVLLIDSKALPRFHALEATVVTPNYQEARLYVEHIGGTLPASSATLDLADVTDVARQLLASLQTEWVAVTLAEHGVLLQSQDQQHIYVPAYQFEKTHDVGAGDSFLSALALALAAGADYEQAAHIAIDAASIVVMKARTSIVHRQELLQRVSVRFYTDETAHPSASGDRQEHRLLLQAQLNTERLRGRKIVFTNGFFNMLHAGHIQFLRQAKALGDILVVGVNSDASVRRLKGLAQFVNNESDRCALVTALGMVDYVIVFDEDTPEEIIRVLQPAIHVKGGDYADTYLPEAQAVREIGGQVVILPLAGAIDTLDAFKLVVSLKIAELGKDPLDRDESHARY